MLLRFDNIELFLNFISENSEDPSIGVYNQFQRISSDEVRIITAAYAKLAGDSLVAIQSNEENDDIDYLDHLLSDSNFTKLNFKFSIINEDEIYFDVIPEN